MPSFDYTFRADFEYRHRNPYHHLLESYAQFVLRDREGEGFSGRWCREVFQNDGPLAVEIGSGYGHFMLEYCSHNPAVNFVGMDYRFKRSFQLAKKIHLQGLNNIRYLRARAERLNFIFGAGEVQKVFCFFPDPWPKNKHHKKRLLQPRFLNNLYQVLADDGEFYIKTDHSEYALWIESLLAKDQRWVVELATKNLQREFPQHFLASYITKFEKIFLAQEVPIKAFLVRKRGGFKNEL